jgi:hypothetical protein
MSRVAALSLWCVLAASAALAQVNPHLMTKPDGSLDMGACPLCHNPDLSLQRSKLETCTLCHPKASHAGSAEHLRVPADAVARAMQARPKDAPALPLAEQGEMYCGTCHLYHDPKVLSEKWLDAGWLPPDAGMSASVRAGVRERWAEIAARAGDPKPVGRFATEGTRQLRLPVDQGQLCLQCHGALP